MVASDLIRSDKKCKIKTADLNTKTSNSCDDENLFKNAQDLNVDQSNAESYKLEFVWKNIIAFIFMHVYTVYGLYYFLMQESYKVIWIQMIYAWWVHMGVTAGAHRLYSHRSYKAKRPLQWVLATLFIAAGQNDIYQWVRDHRVHHKWSETDADPHNSKRGFFFSHIGWLMVKKHPEVKRKGKMIDMSDLENDPMIKFQRTYYKILHPIFVLILPSLITMYYTGIDFPMAFIASIARYQVVLHCTWTVNSFAHQFGTQPYNDRITPKESIGAIIGTIGFGEGYHNYHHTYPWDYKASEFGYAGQWNVTCFFIDMCAYFGWAYDLRSANPQLVNQMKEKVKKHKDIKLSEEEERDLIESARTY